ncbi:hypothetical protein [Aliamphritea hakodatensis]|nr:hypothetical protein [Aliamphritea hakodatensis]
MNQGGRYEMIDGQRVLVEQTQPKGKKPLAKPKAAPGTKKTTGNPAGKEK